MRLPRQKGGGSRVLFSVLWSACGIPNVLFTRGFGEGEGGGRTANGPYLRGLLIYENAREPRNLSKVCLTCPKRHQNMAYTPKQESNPAFPKPTTPHIAHIRSLRLFQHHRGHITHYTAPHKSFQGLYHRSSQPEFAELAVFSIVQRRMVLQRRIKHVCESYCRKLERHGTWNLWQVSAFWKYLRRGYQRRF